MSRMELALKKQNRNGDVAVVDPPDTERGKIQSERSAEGRIGTADDDGSARIPSTTRDFKVDGKTVVLDAEETIVLRCGQASITLHKDGKVVIRGVHVISHASGVNRIRGGSVQLN